MKFNNPMIRHKFTADPTVLEHKGKIYLFTGHDEPPEGVEDYVMNDWLCFSSEDLISWKEYPSPLKAKDFSWSSGDAYASKVIERNNRFYWYVAVSHHSIPGKAIGVAVADEPEGPYRDAKGSALVTGDMLPAPAGGKSNLDPTVLVDDDGQAYLFWGNGTCYYVKLKENMVETDGEIRTVDLPGFSEGAHIYKRGHLYYLMYGSGLPEKVAYAMTEHIDGPWVYKGIVNEVPENCETNRPATIDFKGRSYFFYHNGNLKGGGSHRRSVCADFLYYNPDHTVKPVIMT